MRKGSKCVCETAWEYAQGEPLQPGQVYTVVRSFWRNGEGWVVVASAAGKTTTAPDVFFAPEVARFDLGENGM